MWLLSKWLAANFLASTRHSGPALAEESFTGINSGLLPGSFLTPHRLRCMNRVSRMFVFFFSRITLYYFLFSKFPAVIADLCSSVSFTGVKSDLLLLSHSPRQHRLCCVKRISRVFLSSDRFLLFSMFPPVTPTDAQRRVPRVLGQACCCLVIPQRRIG